jgi:hypothetical protein
VRQFASMQELFLESPGAGLFVGSVGDCTGLCDSRFALDSNSSHPTTDLGLSLELET